MLLHHGVRACLEYDKSRDPKKARALSLSNPNLSPHLSFIDMGGHGYATVRVTANVFETEFVCIPALWSAAKEATEARFVIA